MVYSVRPHTRTIHLYDLSMPVSVQDRKATVHPLISTAPSNSRHDHEPVPVSTHISYHYPFRAGSRGTTVQIPRRLWRRGSMKWQQLVIFIVNLCAMRGATMEDAVMGMVRVAGGVAPLVAALATVEEPEHEPREWMIDVRQMYAQDGGDGYGKN